VCVLLLFHSNYGRTVLYRFLRISDIGRKSRNLYTNARECGDSVGVLHVCFSAGKTRTMWLPYAEVSMMICEAVSIQHWSVTDAYGRTDGRMDRIPISIYCFGE